MGNVPDEASHSGGTSARSWVADTYVVAIDSWATVTDEPAMKFKPLIWISTSLDAA